MGEKRLLLKRLGKMNDACSVAEYTALGGFEGFGRALALGRDAVLDEIDAAMLRGRGGAAYPTGKKWRHLYASLNTPKYVVCNADEGEPGTFKDKLLLKEDPLAVVEGMLIAGWLFGAKRGYIYIRGEYRAIQNVFQKALDNARAAGYLGENIGGVPGFSYDITIVSGAGAYVCGENSALLNSIEGKTGRPRTKPPHLADVGLYGMPTLVNNVESFACVPPVMTLGGEGFRALGTGEGGGTKLVCLSGHAKNRGVYEVPLGTPLEEILYGETLGGGTASGRPVGFCHFGGQSGPLGFAGQLEGAVYSYEGLWNRGLAVGSGAIVVLDSSVNVIEYLEGVMDFFVHESCGKCTPCRLGTTRLQELMQRLLKGTARPDDLVRLENMLTHITALSACGLGQSVAVSVRSALKHRRAAFEALLPAGKGAMA